ncbi:hypothetical protein AAG906_016089 [Vitis piasezkii]
MNFMSYMAEVSRGWDEPNARDMGRMTSQPNAKGEMYILNDGIDMKAKIAAMARRLEKLEMTNMQSVQAISRHHCKLCLVPFVYLMSTWGGVSYHSSREGNVMEDFVEAKKSINAQLTMDQVQNDLSQKIDNLQDSISRFVNLNKVQEKENFPSQPYQNSKGIHEVEAQEGESSMVKEVETVITLRSGKEVDLPTCKLEHKVESETEKEKMEEIKGKKKEKSTEKDDYIDEEPQRIVIKKELMKKHMPPPFLQAFEGCKLHMGSGQAKSGSNFLMDLVFLKTS